MQNNSNYENMTVDQAFEALETPEGQKAALDQMQEIITAPENAETLESIGSSIQVMSNDFVQALTGIYQLFAKIGEKVNDNQEQIVSFLEFAKLISNMSREEAGNYIDQLFKDSERPITQEETAEILNQIYKKPKNMIMPLPKVMDNFFGQGKVTDATVPFDAKVSGYRGKKEAYVRDCKLIIPPDTDDFMLPATLSPFDREVLCGVCSILESGYSSMTSRQIAEAMSGKKQNSPQAIGAVTKSMNKLRTTLASFDWTEHANLNHANAGDFETVIYEDNIIHAEALEIKMYGQTEKGYHILKPPALLSYAKAVGQIATVDKSLLDIQTISNTKKNIVLKNTIIRRIERMKHKKNASQTDRTIKFETLFKNCNINGNSRVEQKRNRDTVFKILQSFVEKGYITAYKEKKYKQAIVSVEITI